MSSAQETIIESPAMAPPDPFDIDHLRLNVNDDADLGMREVLVNVPFRKPSKEQFIRVHPNPDYSVVGRVIELKEDEGETYWVVPELWPSLVDEPTFEKRMIVTAITRQGLVFLWGCKLPGPDGKSPDWMSIPLRAVEEARTQWTKLFWDMQQKRHRIRTSNHLTDDPKWPDLSFRMLLELAFKGRVIDTPDHPVLKKLRGEI